MGVFTEAFFKKVIHFHAFWPYNLAWRLKNVRAFAEFLSNNPLRVFDIGARGDSLSELEPFTPFVEYIGFDADAKEAERLNKLGAGNFLRRHVYPCFIGDHEGEIDFHIYKRPGNSSALKPDEEFKRNYGGEMFGIDYTVKVPAITLDQLIERENIDQPDILKIDTQGTEHEILTASPKATRSSLMIEIEAEFIPAYEGQKLYYDLGRYLHEQGFQLLYINRMFKSRKGYEGPARGQVIYGDFLFGRHESTLKDESDERVAKYAIALVNYGYMDIALQILEARPSARTLIPGIEAYFKTYGGLFSKAKRFLLIQFDKLLAFFLYLRRYNQTSTDSDRSWPIR